MAAIRNETLARRQIGSIVAAALALPSISSGQAIEPQRAASVGVRWLTYHDWQPELNRIAVESPAFHFRAPLGEAWQIEGQLAIDSVSGASPRYHTAISGASKMSDVRRASEIKVTRFEDRSSLAVALSTSDENDYRSRGISGQSTWATEDNNQTYALSLGVAVDTIRSPADLLLHEGRRVLDVGASMTQIVSRASVAQIAATMAYGEGHYSDPYKVPDTRPNFRRQASVIIRWNYHLEPWATTLKSSYRRYVDSFGVQSHTVGLDVVLPATNRVRVTPSIRLYSQSAAYFYYDPVYAYEGIPLPEGYVISAQVPLSADQRLASFGAVTLGLKFEANLQPGLIADLKIERYEQQNRWHFLTPGSRGLAPLTASVIQWGLTRRF